MDFSKFDQQVDTKKLSQETAEIKKNGGTGDYPEIEEGEYICKVEKLEIRETKDGRPMLSAMFRIQEGKHKKQCLFFNRVLYGTQNDASMIAGALTWLDELESNVGPVVFESYSKLNDLVMDIADDISELTYEVSYMPKAFNSIKVTDVFED